LGLVHFTSLYNLASLKDGDEVDAATIIDIYCLYNAEFFAGNYETARIHLKIFDHLAKRAGGFASISFYCKELWATGDVWMAIETLSPPIFTSYYTPLSPIRIKEIYYRLDPADRCIGARSRDNMDLFTPDMTVIITDVIEWAQAA